MLCRVYCQKHITGVLANWFKKWRSDEIKKSIWWCSWNTYEEEFEDQLIKLGDLSEDATKDILHYPPLVQSFL